MNTEESLVEVVNGHSDTGSALQEAVFTYLEQNEVVEKARCYLYDNCIIIKLRVILSLCREPTRSRH